MNPQSGPTKLPTTLFFDENQGKDVDITIDLRLKEIRFTSEPWRSIHFYSLEEELWEKVKNKLEEHYKMRIGELLAD